MQASGDFVMKDVLPILAAVSGGAVAYKTPELANETSEAFISLPMVIQLIGAVVGLLGVIVAAFRGYVAWKEYKLKEIKHYAEDRYPSTESAQEAGQDHELWQQSSSKSKEGRKKTTTQPASANQQKEE